MSNLCGPCDEQHQATQYCVECQEFMCAMLADVHTKLKATKSHILQDANPTADVQSKIDKALGELQQARSDIFVQYADAMPPRNATSPLAVQRANQVFAAFINMGVLINHQHDTLVDMQRSLPRMDYHAMQSVMSSPLFKPDTKALQRYIGKFRTTLAVLRDGLCGTRTVCRIKTLILNKVAALTEHVYITQKISDNKSWKISTICVQY